MDFGSLTIFSTLKSKLNYLSERQAVLAQNIANVDTPNYRAKDVATPDFAKMVKTSSDATAQKLPGTVTMTVTSPMHIAHTMVGGTGYKVENRKNTYEKNPDGNNVSIEEEMQKIAGNQAEYTKSLNLYHKMVTMFNTAIGNSSGS